MIRSFIKSFLWAGVAVVATVLAPIAAQAQTTSTSIQTVQQGQININRTSQRGDNNSNTTSQQGQINTNTTSQQGRINTNTTSQRGDSNTNTTSQKGTININRTTQLGGNTGNPTGPVVRLNPSGTAPGNGFQGASIGRRGDTHSHTGPVPVPWQGVSR
jgi:hypothetical protein